MPAKQHPTNKPARAKPRTARGLHALSSYQSVLDFVNAKLGRPTTSPFSVLAHLAL